MPDPVAHRGYPDLRILRVIPYFAPAIGFGGPPNHAYYLSKELVKEGVHNVVFTTDMFRYGKRFDKYSRKGEVDGIEVHRFPVLAGFRDYWVTPSMLRGILEQRFDIIHAHCYRNFQSDIASLTAKLRGKPFVLTPHGTISYINLLDKFVKSAYDSFTWMYTLRKADLIVAVSRYEYKQLRSIGVSPKKIRTILHGVDTGKFSPGSGKSFREKYGIEGRMILYVGRIHRRKGLQYLAKSLVDIKKRVSDVKLVVVGPDYGYKKTLLKICEKLDLLKGLVFLDYLPHSSEGLIGAYRAADVVVLPAKFEVFGQVIIEAGACGKPVVATKTWGVSELILPEVTGILVNPGDAEGLSNGILRILLGEGFARRMGRRARERVVDRYSWRVTAKRHMDMYRELLQNRSGL